MGTTTTGFKGHTWSSLSRQTGIARTTLQRKINNPSTLTLAETELIAGALDVPATELLAEFMGVAA